MPPAAACGSLPPRSRRKDSASWRASATRTRDGWSTSSTVNPAGWSQWTARRTGRRGGRSWRKCSPPSAARTTDLPIFLFGDETTAEMVPASVLQARQCLHAPVRGLGRVPGARDRPVGAALPRPPAAADVQGADGLHAAGELFLAHARPWWRRRVSQEPGRPAVLSSSSARTRCARTFRFPSGSSARCSTTPDRSPRASATPRGSSASDETLFVVGGTSTANKIVWHGMVGRGDLVLCDRNCHKSILHSLIMTGATPIYLDPVAQRSRHHRTDLQGSVHAGIDSAQDRREPVRQGDERQGPSDGDDQFDL